MLGVLLLKLSHPNKTKDQTYLAKLCYLDLKSESLSDVLIKRDTLCIFINSSFTISDYTKRDLEMETRLFSSWFPDSLSLFGWHTFARLSPVWLQAWIENCSWESPSHLSSRASGIFVLKKDIKSHRGDWYSWAVIKQINTNLLFTFCAKAIPQTQKFFQRIMWYRLWYILPVMFRGCMNEIVKI